MLAGTNRDSINYYFNFTNAPKQNIGYPTALAEAISNENLNGGKSEIVIDFNKNISWYCDTVGNCPANKYDLVTVMMHEIGHGIGYLPSFDVDNSGIGSWGYPYGGIKRPTIYDTACVVGQYPTSIYILTKTSVYPNPSHDLGSALKSNNIYFDGLNVYRINNNVLPKLYAPSTWAKGSSISHLDENSYPHGNSNSLMTPKTDYAEAIHSPGEIGLAMLQDLGWDINRIVTFTSPQGGERWARGETYQIKWTDNDGPEVTLKLYKKNEHFGTFDEVLTLGSFPSYRDRTNTHNWTVPTTLINGIYRLQVYMFSGEGIGLSNVFTISNQVAAPTFSPLGGIYVDPQSVYISCSTPGATIFYTDDGTTPSQSSIPYTNNPITVDTDKTLKAIAYRNGYTASDVGSATYIIGTTGGGLLTVGPKRRDDNRSAIQYISEGSTRYTYDTEFYNRVGTGDFIGGIATNEKARSLLQWNLSDALIPDDAEIVQAQLQIKAYDWLNPPSIKLVSVDINFSNDYKAMWNAPNSGVEVQSGINFSSVNTWQNAYSEGSTFLTQLKNKLPSNRFQLALISQSESVNDKWLQIDLDNTYLTIWFKPPSKTVTFRNNLNGTHNVAQVKIDGVWQSSPFTQPYRWGTNLQIEATAERLNHASNNWKFKKWMDKPTDPIQRNITIKDQLTYQADFEKVYNLTLRNDWEGTTGGQLNYQESPVNSGHTAEDIFKDSPINFSAITPQTNGGITWNFYSWDDGVTSPNRNVTVTSTKEYKAKFKAHLYSNTPKATAYNNSRKIAKWQSVRLYCVYESGGAIWFTESTNNGETWSPEKLLSELPNYYRASLKS
ncbi:MAG: FN3 associated domain-containing protein [Bacteroidota bacterium]|nr:FN3 associated domain-containing protein [Bacteroidota bacterium]